MTENMFRWEQDADGVVLLTMDDPNQGANTMNETFTAGLAATVARLEAEKDTITGVILTSGKKTFFAGGDLKLLSQATKADAAALEEQIYKVVEKSLHAKEALFGADGDGVPLLRRYEQYLYLQSIDGLWKDHLLQMDHLRQGIGLRGYGQRDPKQEYKKEGYEMFTRMTWNVRSSLVGNVLRLVPARQETAEEIEQKRVALGRKQRVIESHPGADGEAEAPKQETVTRDQPKVGRNEPCPCGSGKKYKKCHGASEASA